jgi:ABC-type multidrug transport system fused ATPase/permease subunit
VAKNFGRYMKTIVELKRMVQIANSPVVSLSKEFIEGSTVIRAYNKGSEMLKKFEEKADLYHNSMFLQEYVNLWIRAQIEYSLALIVTFTVFSVVANKYYP